MARATGTAMPAPVPTSGAYGPLAQTLVRIVLNPARLSLRTVKWNTTPGVDSPALLYLTYFDRRHKSNANKKSTASTAPLVLRGFVCGERCAPFSWNFGRFRKLSQRLAGR